MKGTKPQKQAKTTQHKTRRRRLLHLVGLGSNANHCSVNIVSTVFGVMLTLITAQLPIKYQAAVAVGLWSQLLLQGQGPVRGLVSLACRASVITCRDILEVLFLYSLGLFGHLRHLWKPQDVPAAAQHCSCLVSPGRAFPHCTRTGLVMKDSRNTLTC